MKELIQKQNEEIPNYLTLGELRKELSKYRYEYAWALDNVILLFREETKRKGEKVSAEKMEEIIIHSWAEWESSGSPMGYNRGEQIKKNKETGKVFAIVEYDDREGITLRTHLSWFFLLCSLYEEYKYARAATLEEVPKNQELKATESIRPIKS